MQYITTINYVIGMTFFICYIYQFIYIIIPFVKKERHTPAGGRNRVAVLISARNESSVIENLIGSIKAQTYPAELVDIYVVADNCTDNTAEIAESCGADVYKRFDDINIGKGYALDFLIRKIWEKKGENYYDAYLVLDADNVIDTKYIEEMNNTFCDGYEILTSYRNSKNYGDNWITAGYGLWFLRESKYLNYPRYLAGTSCAISGTGFMFGKRVAKELGGWGYYLLTEDIEFTVDHVIAGHKIGFARKAVLFDEQPSTFSQSVRQRMRWAKGYYQVMCHYGRDLLSLAAKKGSFSCLDMTLNIMPALVLSLAMVVINVAALLTGLLIGESIMPVIISIGEGVCNMYTTLLIIGGITTITEWKKIYSSPLKKIVYTFTFPLFMMTYIPITIVAIFKNVEWKPIEHTEAKTLGEITSEI
ncbi:MAG: glycosyltransferase family 2 protein [Clostridia bacterium]|nr:glycosyltransferase family 2 protein [Clostridia bacterium]